MVADRTDKENRCFIKSIKWANNEKGNMLLKTTSSYKSALRFNFYESASNIAHFMNDVRNDFEIIILDLQEVKESQKKKKIFDSQLKDKLDKIIKQSIDYEYFEKEFHMTVNDFILIFLLQENVHVVDTYGITSGIVIVEESLNKIRLAHSDLYLNFENYGKKEKGGWSLRKSDLV